MNNKIKVTLKSEGIREYLRSNSVRKELVRRGNKMRDRAGAGYEVSEYTGTNRARVHVEANTAQARRNESKNGSLRKAVGD